MTTTTTTEPAAEPRTYGNWTKPQTPGLPRLGLGGTVLALGGLVAAVIVQAFAGMLPALAFAVVVLVLLAPLAYRNRAGRNGWQSLTANVAWAAGGRRRQHAYIAGLAGLVAFGSQRLPGLLAPSKLVETTDGFGHPVALVHVPLTRSYTILLRADPDGDALVDPETVDVWVAEYGRFLADLAHEPSLIAASATVETAPDPGFRLAAEVERLLAPAAPALSVQVLRDAATTYPRGSAFVSAHVALTFTAKRTQLAERERFTRRRQVDKSAPKVRSSDEMALMIVGRLPGLLRSLSRTGAGTAWPMSAAEVAEMVRTAYDPAAAEHLDALRAARDPSGVGWETAGPAGAVEEWGSYRHEGAASITWQMVGAPKGAVQSSVLSDLLSANEAVSRKRVTLAYRPHSAAEAASIADADVRTAIGRASARAGEGKATETAQLAAARQAAREEATGAGVTRLSLLVTATVADPARLPQAAETVDQLGRASRLQLRRVYGSQSAGFAAALGVGVVLPEHVNVPAAIREYL